MSRRVTGEAALHVTGIADVALRTILIPTRQALNRAMEGDTVAGETHVLYRTRLLTSTLLP
jgi:hypothetical protein